LSETPARKGLFRANFQTNLIAGLLTVTPLIVVWLVFNFFLSTLSTWGAPLAGSLTEFLDRQFPVLEPWLDNPTVRWWIGVVVGGILAFRALSHPSPQHQSPTAPPPTADAERLLAERFARGEIDVEEYTVRRDLLRSR